MAQNDAKIHMKHLKKSKKFWPDGRINQFLTPRYFETIYCPMYTIVKYIEIL